MSGLKSSCGWTFVTFFFSFVTFKSVALEGVGGRDGWVLGLGWGVVRGDRVGVDGN